MNQYLPHDPLDIDFEMPIAGAHEPCGTREIKQLLDAIAEQLADADRRHSETLQQMQERLAGIGREAQSLRERVPDHLASAFERIEAGMNELKERFGHATAAAPPTPEQHPGDTVGTFETPTETSHGGYQDAPVALRSATEPLAVSTRAREQEAARKQFSDVDTFDVIESSLPGDSDNPWDSAAAEALTTMYDEPSMAYGTSSKIADAAPVHSDAGVVIVSNDGLAGSTTSPASGIDHEWLERRFADIAGRIEQSLADIRPHDGFFALGQRIDGFEQQFANLCAHAASKADVEKLSEIEAHVAHVAACMERTQDQLVRLNAIEDQLHAVSARLDGVHQLVVNEVEASRGGADASAGAGSFVDYSEVARVAADEAAQRVAQLPAAGDASLRPLIERMMEEQRQGEENTHALLDVLQQAMIRLLDRVDAMELAQSAAPIVESAPQAVERAAAREPVAMAFEPDEHLAPGATEDEPRLAMPAQAAMASQTPNGVHGSFGASEPFGETHAEREAGGASAAGGEMGRLDFIAEARRARMRLAGQDVAAEAQLAGLAGSSAPVEVAEAAPAAAKMGAKNARAPKAETGDVTQKLSGPTAPSPRLLALAAALGALLLGLWYTTDEQIVPFGTPSRPSIEGSVPKTGSEQPGADQRSAPAEGAQTPASGIDGSNVRGDLGPAGRIAPGEITVGDASVTGVIIDTDQPLTATTFEKNTRQQAMARMSASVGAAAAHTSDGLVSPAALIPGEDATGAPIQDNTPSAGGRAAALDLPPATVGPFSLRMAAANGDPSAQFEVGARLAEGKGTQQNFAEAAKWYQRSASRGFAPSQYRLGTLYERGLGVPADPARAQDWYRRAAEAGNIKAMHNLAVLSANQNHTSPDYDTAAQWFTEAASRGLQDSQFNLAVLYENGLGVNQDMVEAFKWLSLAAKSNDTEAVRRRDILRGKLTADELQTANALIRSWKPQAVDKLANDARAAGQAWQRASESGSNG